MATQTLISLRDRLATLADHLGESGVEKLLNLYMASTPPLLGELKEAVGQRDEEVRRLAHRFKSAVSYLGAQKLMRLCSQLEDAAWEQDFTRAAARIADLEAAQERLASAWRNGELKA